MKTTQFFVSMKTTYLNEEDLILKVIADNLNFLLMEDNLIFQIVEDVTNYLEK